MNTVEKAVATVDALVAAITDTGTRRIIIRGNLTGAPSFRLSSGQSLRGEDEQSAVSFAEGIDAFSFLLTT